MSYLVLFLQCERQAVSCFLGKSKICFQMFIQPFLKYPLSFLAVTVCATDLVMLLVLGLPKIVPG